MSERPEIEQPATGLDIAIVGMAGRFPGAQNLDAFWQNLCDGVESISFFTDEELKASGVDPAEFNLPQYVRAAPVLKDIEFFDADFFGYSPLEAKTMDPQQRFLLECVWEALEHAGYDPAKVEDPIGVFAGARLSSYMVGLYTDPVLAQPQNLLLVLLGNDISSLSTRISYKLNLRGPSCAVQSGCSTSLVAVHLACQSLLLGECRLAVAGAVTINVPHQVGYLYEPGSMLSPDGHCHTFDAKAAGTVFGSGMGVVILKRLEDALTDGDTIYAVIKGSATNNDGAFKASFTAPSVEGQSAVIIDALASSGIDAETISYLEAHATATALGDPIEVRALTNAFRAVTRKTGFCRIGSVKSNMGHLDVAAGMAGLLKTVFALQHRRIPPSLNFQQPNPEIDFDNSPFRVVTELTAWETDGLPRRAGVSSFGFGGTNAHVIVEEAPVVEPSGPSRPWQLLVLSARTASALESATLNLATHLQQYPELDLADVAFTLKAGRHDFGRRRMLVCHTTEEAVQALEKVDPEYVFTNERESGERPVVFMFPGQGAQVVNMGLELYQTEPAFRAEVDRCAELLEPHLGLDLRAVLYPDQSDEGRRTTDEGLTPFATLGRPTAEDKDHSSLVVGHSSDPEERLAQTQYAQPALFVVEYALAQLWMSWGVQPQALIGHSIGEYVAACLAGVWTLEEALRLVAARGRLMQQLPAGAMLSVPLSEKELRPHLNGQLDLAASNGPALSVVSGPLEAIEALERQLAERGVTARRLHTSHAFHSRMMEPIVSAFAQEVERVRLNPPSLPFISNVTGAWITVEQATDPHYWAQHLRQAVRFAEGVSELFKEGEKILLEVGPGHTLNTLARQSLNTSAGTVVLSSLRGPQEAGSDGALLLTSLGKLWLAGAKLDWTGFYAGERRHRIPLPTYPFERQRYWVDTKANALSLGGTRLTLDKKPDVADWFYLPSWKHSLRPEPVQPGELAVAPGNWLVFVDESGLGDRLARRLQQEGQVVIKVRAGEQFSQIDAGTYALHPRQPQDYHALLGALRTAEQFPSKIVHLWTLTPDDQTPSGNESFEQMQALGFYSLMHLAQALGADELTAPIGIGVISNQLHDVVGGERLCPEKATLLGPARVIPREYLQIACRSLDFVVPQLDDRLADTLIDQILAEMRVESAGSIIAYRDGRRWTQTFESIRLPAPEGRSPRLREQGVYLITGGLGGMGLVLAEHLARSVRAKLILVGRSAFPARAEWPEWLESNAESDATSRKIRQLQNLEALGGEVLALNADVTHREQMRAAVAQGVKHFGALHGVIHAAGIAGGGLIQLKTPEVAEGVLAPKTRGVLALEAACRDVPLDFMVLCSSLTAMVGEFGQSDYAAANAFMDAFAHWQAARGGAPTLTVNWDNWQEVGMAVNTETPPELKMVHDQVMQGGILPAEGIQVFDRILAQSTAPQVLVSTKDLPVRFESIHALTRAMLVEAQEQAQSLANRTGHARPELSTAYVAPRNEFEQNVATVWQQVLGIELVGIHDSFFDLGGHSLLVTQLLNKLHRIYQVEISIQGLFESPTVAGMAGVIEQAYLQKADKPIKEALREAASSERQSLLEAYWKRKIAKALKLEMDQLPVNGSLEGYDVTPAIAEVQWNFQQDLGLQVYPHEIPKLRSIGEMARFTAAELDRLTKLKQNKITSPTPLYDQYEAQSRLEQKVARPLLLKPAQKNAPIAFLLSGPRSGSTLFRVMLAGHPQLFSPPELGILWYDTLRDWQRSMTDPDYGHGFYWAAQGIQWTFMELLGLDSEATKAYMDDLAAQERPIYEVYAELQRRAAPRLLVDKSPSYGMSLETLKRSEEIFAGAKHLYLVRHPHAMIESFVRIRLDKLFGPVIYGSDEIDPFVVAEKVWVTCNHNMLSFLQQVAPERQLRVYYEELVSQPEEIMRGVCDFLGLPYDPAVIQPYDNKRERMISGIGDPNILKHDRVDARLSEAWKRIKLPWRLGDPARQVAAELGYELPAESEAPIEPLVDTSFLEEGDAAQLLRLVETVKQLSPDEVKAMLAEVESSS
ncbi:MAG TPA: SDR family NAD(P)-dependent oxidoreductase [Anaerolineae bacterium]|nr:SDR family NAD(P)-dependent oxidoreductase [Anaerolineae bacterium]